MGVEPPRVVMSPYSCRPWHRWYLLLAAGSIILVALVANGVYPFSLLSPLAASAIVVTTMLVTSVAHHLDERRRFDRRQRL